MQKIRHEILRSSAHSAVRCLLLACIVASCFPGVSAAGGTENFPRPAGAINDFANVIAPDVRARMEGLSREILEKTGTAVVVATVQSTGGQDPDMYATDLYAAWGIGKKGEDKGVLILLAVQERRVRIETGYGVEGILPDGLVGSILDQYVMPYLKTGNYGQGLFNGQLAVGKVIAQDAGVTIGQGYRVERPPQPRRQRGSGIGGLALLALLFLLILTPMGRTILAVLFLSGMSGGRGGGFGGGGFGGFGGGMSGGGGASRSF